MLDGIFKWKNGKPEVSTRFFHIYINFTPVYENWGMQSAVKMIKVHEITAITIIYCRKTKQFDFYQE